MAFIEVAKAAKGFDVKSSQIHSVRLEGTIPEWMQKRGQFWYVDTANPDLHLWLRSKKRKANITTISRAKQKRLRELDGTELDVLNDSETKRLQEVSIQAELSKPIISLRLDAYKIEAAKLKLEQQAGVLISRELAEFLYTGYVERMNRELLQYQNKVEVQIEHLASVLIMQIKAGEEPDAHAFARKITQLSKNETEDIIRNIKSNQLDELKRWAKENGVHI